MFVCNLRWCGHFFIFVFFLVKRRSPSFSANSSVLSLVGSFPLRRPRTLQRPARWWVTGSHSPAPIYAGDKELRDSCLFENGCGIQGRTCVACFKSTIHPPSIPLSARHYPTAHTFPTRDGGADTTGQDWRRRSARPEHGHRPNPPIRPGLRKVDMVPLWTPNTRREFGVRNLSKTWLYDSSYHYCSLKSSPPRE